MTHETPLPQCQQIHDEFREHQKESMPVRSKVDTTCQQILTLEKAHEATMADIKEIKHDIASINYRLNEVGNGIKIWVLGGIGSIAIVFAIPTGMLFYSSGKNDEKVGRLEQLHPYGISVQTISTNEVRQ